ACRLIGIDVSLERAKSLLEQMRHDVMLVSAEQQQLRVEVAPYRNDIMHEVDLIEDLAIAYDYQNIVPSLVPNLTVAQEREDRKLANRARQAMLGMGFFEAMSLLLSSPQEQYASVGLSDPGEAVVIDNPASVEQSIMRTHILPQLLRLFGVNRGQGLPQRLFEVDDVVILPQSETYPRERLHLAAGLLDTGVGFADIKAVCEALLFELGLSATYRPVEHPAFLPGRVAEILLDNKPLGILGEIHPRILEQEELRLLQPLAVMELCLQDLLPKEDLYHLGS
ncbi:MAG: hypothetical protein AAGJ35_06875, partial [Myxococcota bacterium]